MNKLYDCVTFFQENLQMELRFFILNEVVNKFIVCESIYDHRGKEKKINFKKQNFPEFINKIEHVIIEKKFPKNNTPWQNQSWQREFIFEGIKEASNEDLIMFSDPDEIPNPKKLKNLELKKKFGIFFQNMYTYKLNLFNKHESPWEGTRICKKKNLKSFDWLRHQVLSKNLKYSFWRIDKEKNIQIINDGGWHFNYLLKPEEISKKLKSLAETSWDNEKYSNLDIIKKKISDKIDLFDRGHVYKKVMIDNSYPDYILKNKKKLEEWIL
mgnify:CR=1 FL=1|tara:strand:+ start:913 stop:1719 length:807 start_codon:yes stop_codon:yes gene_type:complete